MTSDDDAERVRRLVAVFTAKKPDGTPRFPRRELLAFLPVLLHDIEGPLPAGLAPLIEESAAILGVKKGMSPADVKKQLDAHYAKSPHFAELSRELTKEMGLSGVDTTRAAGRLNLK